MDAVLRLLQRHGYPPPESTRQLRGGNNRTTLLQGPHYQLVAKAYFHSPDDTRDRLGAEFAFSQWLWSEGVRNIAQPIGCDEEARVGLYQALPGRPLTQTDIDLSRVEQLIEFFLEINRHKQSATPLPPASEACFSWAAHRRTVSGRVHRLQALEHPEARHFGQKLSRAWQAIQAHLPDDDKQLSQAERCLSPSDFGFHNALLDQDTLYWLDFEYAGWDDPAKTVCDAVCQPALPLPTGAWPRLLAALEATARARAEQLLPAYQIKWCCIMLNEFTPEAQARRAFAGHPGDAGRLQAQLAKAERLLSATALPPLGPSSDA